MMSGNYGAPSIGSAASQFLGGLFPGSNPYQAGINQFNPYFQQGAGYQNPFYQAGTGAIGNYQNWANQMKNPSQFINSLMNQYQASPSSQFLQQQAMRGADNAASASGLLGSSALSQQEQQNAANISSQDMNNWLSNVLGINTQYGQSQAGLMDMGQQAANNLSNMYGNAAGWMGNAGYGSAQWGDQNNANLISGALGLFGL